MKTQVHTFRVRLLTLVMLMTAGLFSAKSFAQKTWVGNNNSNWNNASNWSPSGVPASTDAVTFNTARTVMVDVSPTIKSLTISGSVAVKLAPSSSSSRTITISNPGNTALNIQSGSTLTLDGFTGFPSSSSLTLGFSGVGNVSTIAGTLGVNGTGNNGIYNATNSTTTISGTLNVSGGNYSTSGGTATISGTTNVSSGSFTASSGTTTVSGTLLYTGGTITSNAANLIFASGGLYNHDVDGGTIPTATWNTGSTCDITGNSGAVPGGLNPTGGFSNFTWNSPGMGSTDILSFAGALGAINGDFTITSTGTGSIRLLNSGTHYTLNVGGNFIQTGGTFYTLGTGATGTSSTMNIAGDFSLSGGTFNVSAATSGGATDTGTVKVAKNFSFTGGTITEAAGAGFISNIRFNGTGTQTFTSGGAMGSGAVVNFIVESGSTLQMGTGAAPSVISGSGAFTLNDGATLGVTSPAGITTGATGNIQTTTRNYFVTLGSSSFIYNGTAAQVTGNGLPSSVKNLLMSNSAGLSLTNTAIVTGTLTLISGNIDASAKLLSLSTGASIIGGSPSSYILAGNGSGAGGFKRSSLAAGTTYNFPVGTSAYYLPAAVKPTTANIDWSAYAFTPATKNGQYNGTQFSASQLQSMVNAIWVVTPSTTSTTADLTLDWASGATLEGSAFAVANSSSYGISHYNGSTWDPATNTGGTTATSVTSTFSSFSPFGIGFAGNPLPVVLVDFNAALNNDKSVDLSWETQMELNSSHFNVLRSADGSNWSSIGTVEAKGNSSVITDYSFNDKNPLSGVNYYRLQMVDIDGHFGYSEVKVVKTTLIAGFSIFPNPAKDYINVSLNASSSALTIRLINQSGQILQEKSVNSSSASIVSLPVYSYPQGNYYLQVSSAAGAQQTSKVLITR